jgi:uncharacterized phage-associated protein
MGQTFCEECRDMVDYTVKKIVSTQILKGAGYEFVELMGYCVQCGAIVDVHEFNDINLKSLYGVYRERNGLISFEDASEISKKYSIGAQNLSLMLGWGEHTYSRCCENGALTKQYSDILKHILAEPEHYLALLEAGRDRLPSEKAYVKSKRAAEKYLTGENLDGQRIKSVSDYLLATLFHMTAYQLQKSLYYIQGFSYAFLNAPLFDDSCEAWVHGPVYRNVFDSYRGRFGIEPLRPSLPDMSIFSDEGKELVDAVIKHICCYSGDVLERFTHAEQPWIEARQGLSPAEASDRVIKQETIKDYFVSVKKAHKMRSPADIRRYAAEKMRTVA